MKVNINVSVAVTLTMTGAAIYNEHMGEFPKRVRDHVEPGKTITMPLWSLMEIFGPHLHMGMVTMPFEKNAVDLLPDNLEQALGNVEYESWSTASDGVASGSIVAREPVTKG
jgi:hypothetical protein